ncbi:MAG: glycosyl transferase group 1, partial [Chloroflexi bacterium]|nr:glycosyl transferase group 1 [Chloroflexota bacterium]
DTYFLIVSRLLAYKRIDIAIHAFNELELPLVIVGDGPDRDRLLNIAGPTIQFKGRLPRAEVCDYLARCRALILPGEEDFGLTPLEAQASGRPVVAYRGGGAVETVLEGTTGWFFDEPTPQSLVDMVQSIDRHGIDAVDSAALREHARAFDVSVFREKIASVVSAS